MHHRAAAMVLLAWLAVAGAAAAAEGGPVREAPAPLARLEILDHGQGPEAWAENLLSGPVEVVLRARDGAPRAQPALPARATVTSRGRVLVARLERADAAVVLEVVPGHPGARPRDVEYAWPLATRGLSIAQGWGGAASHRNDENRHAVDFAVEEGTPVLAARDGVVMQAEARFAGGGLGPTDAIDRANFVRILHDDGTMALYAHLAPGGVHIRPGDRVRRGQHIATSGNTGYSGGPHLHFAVQANRGLRLASIPFKMFGPGGILRFSEAAEGVE
ncbi:M23 family metallopeptidase [Luteimonas arsenica]|uniref:M23 family metallopeptidase n=1 Tax=Luteimonas arsenica TaxID=1586242 RepID=UPI00105598C4|nr:M23 family metallopeptidase [Luteimonas arsenica]